MAGNDTSNGLARELTQAIDELETALHRTTEAAARIRELVPRVAAFSSLLDELEGVILSRRQELGDIGAEQPVSYSRPTLVVPNSTAHAPTAWAPKAAVPPTEQPWETPATAEPPETQQAGDETLTSFRLEFYSQPGPLDLRAVDEAVGEHPAVRDVALLDYDGRRATLKVWIEASASPADVQASLQERAQQLFGTENDVSIAALEDAA